MSNIALKTILRSQENPTFCCLICTKCLDNRAFTPDPTVHRAYRPLDYCNYCFCLPSFGWESKGRYGSFRCGWTRGVQI